MKTRMPVARGSRDCFRTRNVSAPCDVCGAHSENRAYTDARPILVNAALLTLGFTLMMMHMNTRFQNLKEMWRAELHRDEGVLDARLKHLEECA